VRGVERKKALEIVKKIWPADFFVNPQWYRGLGDTFLPSALDQRLCKIVQA